MSAANQTSEDLVAQRERFRTRTFQMMLQIVFVFGIPAAVAVIAGKSLDAGSDGKTWTFGLLAMAFVLSWFITIRIYLKLSHEAKVVDKAVREAKNNSEQQAVNSGQKNKNSNL